MRVTTPSGDAYELDDLAGTFAEAGSPRRELRERPPTFRRLVISSA